MKLHHLLFIFSGYILCGFEKPEGVDPDEYVLFYQQHMSEFSKSVNDGSTRYTLSLLPTELKVIHDFNTGDFDVQIAEKQLLEEDDQMEFILNIEIPEFGNQEFLKFPNEYFTYEQRVEYYSFEIQKDILVSFDNGVYQTINAYTFERNFGLSPKGTASIFVKVPKKAINITFKIQDKIYGTQVNEMIFDLKTINELPKLKKVKKWEKQQK